MQRGFDQAEQVMQYFIKAVSEWEFAPTTDLLIYGDHRNNVQKVPWLEKPERRVLLMLPLHGKKRVMTPASAYDIGPTILDTMGVCYSPPFACGRSLISESEVGLRKSEIPTQTRPRTTQRPMTSASLRRR
jgi:hypothetical protein